MKNKEDIVTVPAIPTGPLTPELRAEINRTLEGAGLKLAFTDVRSGSPGMTYHDVYFTEMSDAELRKVAESTGPGNYFEYDRAMLMALLTNRWKCGFVRVIDSVPPDVELPV